MKLLFVTTAAAALALGMSAAQAQTSDGGGASQMPPPAASGGASGSGATRPAEMPNRAQAEPGMSGGASAQGDMKQNEMKGGARAEGEMKQNNKAGTSAQENMKGDTKSGSSAEGGTKQDDMKSGRAAAPKDLTTEQRTVIREKVITGADRVNVNFNFSVGAVIPQTVHTHLHPLPPTLIEIYPAYRGYSYIVLSDGRLVIIEPSTYEVITVVSI